MTRVLMVMNGEFLVLVTPVIQITIFPLILQTVIIAQMPVWVPKLSVSG